MEYDFRLTERAEQTPLTRPTGLVTATDAGIEIMFKRRQDIARDGEKA